MSTIRAGNTQTTGLTYTSDTTGQLNLESQNGIVVINGTGALTTPAGTTAERPSIPSVGMTRYNTTDNVLEVYTGTEWKAIGDQARTYGIEILVVAGGGAGGRYGGGGAGGLVYYGSETPKTPNGSIQQIFPGTSHTVVVGAGGAGIFVSGAPSNRGGSGTDSQFGIIASTLGGGGGGESANNIGTGANGGSGGGGGYDNSAGGSGTSGQGFAGGTGTNNGTSYSGGGGGGSGTIGGNASNTIAGNGGTGLSYSISGSALAYAGGGGGATYRNADTAGSGGSSVGGTGAKYNEAGPISIAGSAGISNRGGGGGGGAYSGGSGIVIVRYLGSQRGSGGTITSSGGYTIHTFTSSGTFIA